MPDCLSKKEAIIKLLNKDETFNHAKFLIKNYRAGKYAIYESVYYLWLFLVMIFPLLIIPTTEILIRAYKRKTKWYYFLSMLIIAVDLFLLSLIAMPFL